MEHAVQARRRPPVPETPIAALPQEVTAAIDRGELSSLLLDVQGCGLTFCDGLLDDLTDEVARDDGSVEPGAGDPPSVGRMTNLLERLGLEDTPVPARRTAPVGVLHTEPPVRKAPPIATPAPSVPSLAPVVPTMARREPRVRAVAATPIPCAPRATPPPSPITKMAGWFTSLLHG